MSQICTREMTNACVEFFPRFLLQPKILNIRIHKTNMDSFKHYIPDKGTVHCSFSWTRMNWLKYALWRLLILSSENSYEFNNVNC